MLAQHSHSVGPVTAGTRYQFQRLAVRFDAYRRATPVGPLAVVAQAWLRTLPASQQPLGRCALRMTLGKDALDWSALELATYHRDETTLRASVLTPEQRGASGRWPRTPASWP